MFNCPNRSPRRLRHPGAPPAAACPAGSAANGGHRTAEGRLERLRGRLARSQNALGRSLLGLIGGGDLDEGSWEQVEDTLLVADLGPTVTASVVSQLRSQTRQQRGPHRSRCPRGAARGVDHRVATRAGPVVRALPHDDHPSVLLVVGVNGTGKTTTVGKLARVLVADGRRVVLGAADTFRAAAADQLQAWASRVGAEVVRGARAPTGVGGVRRRRQGHRRRRRRRGDRHRRPAAHQDRADGRARQGQTRGDAARGGRRGAAGARRHRSGRTGWRRRGCSPMSSISRARC